MSEYLYYRQQPPDGWIVKDERGKVYQIDHGKKRWIVNPIAYHSLYRGNPGDALFFPGLSNVADGPVIGDGTGLFRTTATGGKVFWLDKEDGVTTFKRWITSPEAMDRYHFTWDRIPTLPGNFADIPDGSPISV
ncbi:hypothetical protein CUC15_05975 [Oceanobacillus zhaokaii]|uniref:Uncharacterized protein n=1 Tax=Oceanobacillus zhaokaii TaxID=2052660 RepID=A0A345PER3_9BACI|nr:hypothetical protein [Oceanobacillus zhaokaii]AXI08493.1 hypothetical protein CUC15_05975 [Oceanobacillus zhaokaii]